jgi:hypothetical protein
VVALVGGRLTPVGPRVVAARAGHQPLVDVGWIGFLRPHVPTLGLPAVCGYYARL